MPPLFYRTELIISGHYILEIYIVILLFQADTSYSNRLVLIYFCDFIDIISFLKSKIFHNILYCDYRHWYIATFHIRGIHYCHICITLGIESVATPSQLQWVSRPALNWTNHWLKLLLHASKMQQHVRYHSPPHARLWSPHKKPPQNTQPLFWLPLSSWVMDIVKSSTYW